MASETVDGCIFCRIGQGEAEVSVVYEDDAILAIPPLAPINPGHTLVIPKRYASGLADLDSAVGARYPGALHCKCLGGHL